MRMGSGGRGGGVSWSQGLSQEPRWSRGSAVLGRDAGSCTMSHRGPLGRSVRTTAPLLKPVGPRVFEDSGLLRSLNGKMGGG